MKMGKGKILVGLLVAGVFHWYLRLLPSPFKSVPLSAHELLEALRKKDEAIAIEPYEEKQNRKVVQTSRVEEDASLSDEKAKYLGEFKNRVKTETQGIGKGAFREGRSLPIVPVPSDTLTDSTSGIKMSELMAFGASPHDLGKEVGVGNQTVLNTDPVKYASFINRIANQVYEPWVVRAREAVRLLYGEGRKLESNTYITRLQVVMDSAGDIRAIQTLQGSGIDELDRAPKEAFWDIEKFPHPPEQMFKGENLVRFVYEFHFEWQTSAFNIISPI